MKKLLFLISFIFCLFLFLGIFDKTNAETTVKCCVGVSGATKGTAAFCAEPSSGSCSKDQGVASYSSCSSISDCVGSGPNGNSSCTGGNCEFINPIGVNSVSMFLNNFLTKMRGVVVVIAIIFIVLGGIMYMLSAGSEKMVTRAKMCWTGAVIGLAIVLAAPSFLTEIITILGGSSEAGVESPGGIGLYQIATNILNLLLSVLGIIAIISLVVGGGMYLTAYGDEKRIETGKKIATYSIIGIIIALSAVVIINEINRLITGS